MSAQQTSNQGSVIEVFITFLKLGLTSFGGPVAHLGYFHRELIERRQWLGESQFGQLLAICQFLPGPASSQLGFALGLLRAGWLGALAAFVGFTLPSALLMIGFASILSWLSGPLAEAAIDGLKPVACAVVADAVWGMSKKLCPDRQRRGIALLAICTLLLMDSVWAQLLVVVGGSLAGALLCRISQEETSGHIRVAYGKRTGLLILFVFLVLLCGLALAPAEMFSVANAFFQAGALVFGGGHVVLPLLENSVVANGWISNESFLAGYGAAQAIPGPMFAFAAYLGALIPLAQAPWLGALVALVCIFLPGFLLLVAVLPWWQSFYRNSAALNAIAGLNAAVVGILGAALYDPVFTSGVASNVDLTIGIIGFGLLTLWQRSPLWVVIWCVAAKLLLVTI
ncbi:chromate efflux transporter [Aestuariirhabdus sp. Z084]|uniref:chromate efflux transporter n=1 Tax=Aestuariirhabdus haliotis TaxID=2918751 RepID=UPI00201B3EC6|nr:chromate efflux transporter [Aestuariirhabdus haliotis]MCL6414363.1 chromate efflux transporter [Aestuariirhabdus haliotis]MCL6418295.1 chromate efflux transporter [Aestuariirhabdus haliotis]